MQLANVHYLMIGTIMVIVSVVTVVIVKGGNKKTTQVVPAPISCCEFTCGIGSELIDNPGLTEGSTSEVCCKTKMCNEFEECGAGKHLIPNASEVAGFTDDVCCEEPLCNTITCGLGEVPIPDARGSTAEDCCESRSIPSYDIFR